MDKWAFEKQKLDGVYKISSFYVPDVRGGFCKDYSKEDFLKNGIDYDLAEVFYTYSHKGVIRAIHFQLVKQQPKLVRCVSGHVYDVIVDLRKDSKTYKQWLGFDLTDDNHVEILVPAGFGHGYLVLEESIVSYKCAEKFYGEYDSGIMWNDPDLGIVWPLDRLNGSSIILADKDRHLMSFKDYEKFK